MGQIPRTPRRLYKVEHAPESANAAGLLSVMELHRRLGHIAVASARKLAESGAVTGIDLNPSSEGHDCDACIFARATRLPVPKTRIGPPAQTVGDEIHTDIWGPASTATRKGRRYFVTFTDDATRFTTFYLKDEALAAYKSFEAWSLTQGHCSAIKALCFVETLGLLSRSGMHADSVITVSLGLISCMDSGLPPDPSGLRQALHSRPDSHVITSDRDTPRRPDILGGFLSSGNQAQIRPRSELHRILGAHSRRQFSKDGTDSVIRFPRCHNTMVDLVCTR